MKSSSQTIILISTVLGLSLSTEALAQQTPYVVGSTVNGHVFCADTSAPARFAKVLLKSIVPSHTGEDFVKNMQDNLQKSTAKSGKSTPAKTMTDDQKHAMAAAAKGMNQVTDMMNASTVGLDGAYSFAGVKPGTYYVHAIYPGYIDPFADLSDNFNSADPVIRDRIAQIPTITVTGTDSARADLRLERGAAVSGRILFDDGSPASGWSVSLIKPKTPDDPGDMTASAMAPALAMSGAVQVFKTDDLGRYRISGITGGEYALRANLVATAVGVSASNIGDGGSGINLAVYTGDTFSRAEAKTFKLASGDEEPSVDITIPSRKLHNITGHVYAKSDGHTLNVGSVSLARKDNPALHLKAAIRDDGSFHFEYLPGGNYTLTVQDAADGRHKASSASFMGMNLPNQEILHKYGTDVTEVVLDDMDIDSVRLTVAQTDWTPPQTRAGSEDASPGDLLNSLFSGGSDEKPKP